MMIFANLKHENTKKNPERPKKLQRPPTAFGALSKRERDAARRRPERERERERDRERKGGSERLLFILNLPLYRSSSYCYKNYYYGAVLPVSDFLRAQKSQRSPRSSRNPLQGGDLER